MSETETEMLRAELRRLEGQLQEKDLQLATAQRAAHLGVWSWSIDTDTVRLSDSARLILGMAPGTVTTSFAEILARVHPEDLNGLRQTARAIERGQPVYSYTYRTQGADGALRFIRGEGEAEFDSDGKIVRLVGTVFDLTTQHELLANVHVAEDSARRAETLLRRAMRLGRLAAWNLDLQTRMITWSSEVLRLPGGKPGMGVPLKELLQVVHPGSRALLQACLDECVAKHKPFEVEVSVRGGGRRMIWLRVMGERVHGTETGERISGAVQDITEQREASDRVADLSRRLTQTLENTPEAFVAYDASWRFTYVNHHAEALLGKPRESLLGTYWFDSFPAMRDSSMHRNFAKALAEFRTVEFEARSPHSGRWFQLTAYPSVDGLAVSCRDISDQIALRRELERTQERYRRLFETSVDAIFQTAPDGSIEAANRAACEMFGRSEEEFRRLGRGAAVDLSDPRLALLLQQRESTGWASGQLRMVRSDGSRFEADVTSAKYVGRDGREYANVFVRDATGRIRAEERLARWNNELSEQVRKRTAELEAANEQLRSFSYSVAHDLQSPIAAVTTFAEELQSSLRDQCSQREQHFLERIRLAGVRMGEFVEGMLALAMVSRTELTVEEVDLSEIARELAAELRDRDRTRSLRFDIVDGAVVRGDRRLLRMALQNLLSNAWKFTCHRETAEIRFACTRIGEELVYSVSDNGAGFDMAYADKLFGPFQRLHSYSEFPGSGIGLSNVQRIVLRHGGRIWAQGETGRGARFSFTLSPG